MKKLSIQRMFLLTILLGIGMNIHHPVTPTLFTDLNLPARIFGTSFAIMAFFSFLTAPFWGQLSDRIGRIKVFMISCVVYGIAQFFLGFSSTEVSVLVSRALAGAFGAGASIVTMAYIVDISEVNKRASNIAIYTALQSISLAIGYLMGGFLGTISFKLAFNTQAIWMILIGILGMIICEESYVSDIKISKGSLLKSMNPLSLFKGTKSFMNNQMIIFLIIALLTAFASSCYDNAFNYYLKDQLHFLPAYNGILKAVIGLIGLVANFTINIWIIKKTNTRKSLIAVLLLCAITSFSALLSSQLILFILFNISFFTVNAIYLPIIQAMAVDGKERNVIGVVTGIFGAIRNMGSVFGSLLAGFVYGFGNQYPFIISGLLFILSVVFAYVYYLQHSKQA